MTVGDTGVVINVVDLTPQAVATYGRDRAEELFGPLPEHDYRFEVHWPSGARTTFHAGAGLTADRVVELMTAPPA